MSVGSQPGKRMMIVTSEHVTPRGVPADEIVARGLTSVSRRIQELGVTIPALRGQLLRPLFGLAMVPADRWPELDERFWCGILAVQMVHEASLLHDDVIDAASERRGEPTVAATLGAGAAVVLGDHYLTGAYRAAVGTGSFAFLERFTRAVERTVAGEMDQESSTGRVLTPLEYERIVAGKSGELFGAAAALGGHVAGLGASELREQIGRDFGSLYQRIDDLLDYCTDAGNGKPPKQDYRQRKWSWILDLAGVASFDLDDAALERAVFQPTPDGPSAARRALERLRATKRTILLDARRVGVDGLALDGLVQRCLRAAEDGVAGMESKVCERDRGTDHDAHRSREAAPPEAKGRAGELSDRAADDVRVVRAAAEASIRERAAALGGPVGWVEYFGHHGRTFRLASRLFPPREGGMIAGLYAYCRFTDDLVDDPESTASRAEISSRLSVWRALSLQAFDSADTGIAILDRVLGSAAEAGVDRAYPTALLDGVGIDLTPRIYETWADLKGYTFGVAGAVGGWIAQMFGIHDPLLLDRAHALGHAMQLTNIARDVGEDWARGRIYLPRELLSAHGLVPEDVGTLNASSGGVSAAYRGVIRELIERADDYYEVAWPGIRRLPANVRRPVAAAASAYRGIHREIRRNGYDNLTRRAHTSSARRLLLVGSSVLGARVS